jgi:hypothetical protein
MTVQSGRKDGAPSPSSVSGLAIESISHVRAAENHKSQNKRGGGDQGENNERTIQSGLGMTGYILV